MAEMTLTDVVKELRKQGNTLNSVKDFLAAEQQRAIEQSRKDLETSREKKGKTGGDSPKGFVAGLKAGISDATGFTWLKNILSGIFGGATIATLLGALGKVIGRGLAVAGLITLWKTFNEKFFDGLFKLVNEYLPTSISNWINTNETDIKAAMDRSITFGLTGLLFGKKAAIFLALGSLLGDALGWGFKSVFGFSIGDTQFAGWTDEQLKKLGIDKYIDAEGILETVGGIVALIVGKQLIGGVFRSAVFGSATATILPDTAKDSVKKGLIGRLGGGAKLMRGLGLFAVGTVLAEAITAYTGDDSFGSDIAGGIQIASLFAMGGPYGLLIGAIIGTAYAGFNVVSRLIEQRSERIQEEIRANLIESVNQFGASIDLGDEKSAKKALQEYATAMAELKSPQEIAQATAQLQEMNKIYENLYGKGGGMTDAEIQAAAAAAKPFDERSALEAIMASVMQGGRRGDGVAYLTEENIKEQLRLYGAESYEDLSPEQKQTFNKLMREYAGGNRSEVTGKLRSLAKEYGINEDEFVNAVLNNIAYTAATKGRITSNDLNQAILDARSNNSVTMKQRKIINDFVDDPNAVITKAIDNYNFEDLKARSSALPPMVVNQTNSPTTVSNTQSMVTNNGPAVDTRDFMLMSDPLRIRGLFIN